MDAARLRALLDVGRSLVAQLDTDAVLTRLLDVARVQTGARYAAIGVLDEHRERLERFLTAGLDDATRAEIGDPPRGRGLLGVLISDPRPVRTPHLAAHPASSGFPAGHPPMDSFLGVPILIHGEAWGNLYLTDKAGGQFDAGDEEVATVLADWAAIAIENARLYRDERERRDELERANHRLQTTIEVSRGLGGVTDPAQVLELVTDRSRALLGARSAELAVRDGDGFVVAAASGDGADALRGTRLPLENSLAAITLRVGRARHFPDIPEGTFARDALGAREAVVAPMLFRGRGVGVLVVLDRIGPGPFGEDDVQLLEALAAGAATAVATAQEAHDEALRSSIRASEEERRRWARELHDQTLQDLAAVRVLLAAARNSPDGALRDTVDHAVELLGGGVGALRALINDLRPPALDELGVAAALDTLVERVETVSGLEIDCHVDLAYEDGRAAARHPPEVELAMYRLVQEALTNAVKHAQARRALVQVIEHEDCVEVEVRDDGHGFRPERRTGGFGLVGMRERLAAVGATLDIRSEPDRGTTLRARIPTNRG
jgi:signal transduction histidine kinase